MGFEPSHPLGNGHSGRRPSGPRLFARMLGHAAPAMRSGIAEIGPDFAHEVPRPCGNSPKVEADGGHPHVEAVSGSALDMVASRSAVSPGWPMTGSTAGRRPDSASGAGFERLPARHEDAPGRSPGLRVGVEPVPAVAAMPPFDECPFRRHPRRTGGRVGNGPGRCPAVQGPGMNDPRPGEGFPDRASGSASPAMRRSMSRTTRPGRPSESGSPDHAACTTRHGRSAQP